MFSVLLSSVACKPPIVLVPPMFGSVLYGNINNLKTHWYCAKNKKDEFLWIRDKYLIPPLVSCLAEYIKVEWDDQNKRPKSRNNTEIFTIDFGGLSAVKYIDRGVLGKHFIPDLIYVINRLEEEGYKERVDLFGAPYDWRMNPMYMDEFFENTKKLIEEVYTLNDNQKVRMYGISAGCMAIHLFLTTYVTQEWKDKYIHEALLHGPSFGGSGIALMTIWDDSIEFLPGVYNTKATKSLLLTIPTVYGHLPNAKTNDGTTFIVGPDGRNYYASDLPQLLLDNNKVPEAAKEIFKGSIPYTERDIKPLGVPTYLLFNSVLQTQYGASFTNGFDKKYTPLYGLGDNTIPKQSLYYACNNWRDGKPIVCHDININDTKYTHSSQLKQKDVMDIIWQVFKDDSWQVNGTFLIKGNTTEVWKTLRNK